MSQLCTEFQTWVEEDIEKPIDVWVEKKVEQCKKKKCRKWCLCCNKWFCWIQTIFVTVVRWIVVTVIKWVVRVVCEIVSVLLDAFAGIISLLFAIPILGRILRQLWDAVIDLIWRLIGIIGIILDLLGFDWEKKYRICIIILSDQNGGLTTRAALEPTIQSATTTWKSAANVRLIVEDVHTVEVADRRERNLDVECDTGAWTDDLLATGSNFELFANIYCFDGTGRRLIGWAAPVVVFVVRDVKGNYRGCSLGPFSDYVTIEAKDPACMAHELGHAAYPWWHHSNPNNLMYHTCGGTQLKKWQKILIRDSRHVTYL